MLKLSKYVIGASALVIMAACQNPAPKETAKETTTVTTQQKHEAFLNKGVWEDKLYQRLENLIAENGKTSANYQQAKQPYAVFDWDNTSIINDIGEATLTYQAAHLMFKMTPEQFNEAIRKNLPLDNFKEEWNNTDNQAVNIEKIATDLNKDYTVLYQNYEKMQGKETLEAIKKRFEYQDFITKLRYLYEAVGDSFSSDISYPWVTYLFTGMTSDEVQALSKLAIDENLKAELRYETWESPAELKGEAGQVRATFKVGIRAVKEMQNLYKTLLEQGIDVYICSASYVDVVIPFATDPAYGYNLAKDHIYGMILQKDEKGVIQTALDTNYVQTQGKGKTETINKFMSVKHANQQPILIAGDSNGDVAMLTDFDKLQIGIIFNRLRSTEKGIGALAKKAVEHYDEASNRYFLQGRDENKGVLIHDRETILLDETTPKLFK